MGNIVAVSGIAEDMQSGPQLDRPVRGGLAMAAVACGVLLP